MDTGTFWVGSNGNLFCDSAKHRYCIAKAPVEGYHIARNGHIVGHETSVADAKVTVTRLVRDDE